MSPAADRRQTEDFDCQGQLLLTRRAIPGEWQGLLRQLLRSLP